MILDSSALGAVIFQEQEAERLLQVMEDASWLGIGAPTLAETQIVVGSRLGFDKRIVTRLLDCFPVSFLEFGPEHSQEAVRAYAKFGKGRHRAALNFGDCMTYAVASLSKQPLLCLGDDFCHTDLLLQKY